MLSKRTGVCVAFPTSRRSAKVRFVSSVNVRMLFPIARVGKATIASRKFTHERFLPSMGALMYFEIFRASKRFTAVCERARKWLLSSVDPNVVDKLVFGIKRLAFPVAIAP
mgnify:CR=1 FL=1